MCNNGIIPKNKKLCAYLNWKNILLLKNANCYLNLQEVIIFLLVEGLASVLMAAEYQGGGCWGDSNFFFFFSIYFY